MGCTFLVDAVGSTTQNDSDDFMLRQLFGRDEARVQFTVNVKFTDATGNQMGKLGSKVQDGDLGANEMNRWDGWMDG